MLLDAVHRLERIDLAGEPVGAAVAAVEAQDEGAGRHEIGVRLLAAVDEVQLAERLAAAVAPEVEAMFVRRIGLVGRRHDEAVGLHGAVDVARRSRARGRWPWSTAPCRRAGLGPFVALFQERLGRGDLLGRVAVKLVVGQGVADGVVINLHVGQQIEEGGLVLESGAEVVDLLAEFLDAGLEMRRGRRRGSRRRAAGRDAPCRAGCRRGRRHGRRRPRRSGR